MDELIAKLKPDFLRSKTILVLSPQSWGRMLISKHHYALELAKRGNRVYYLNPPENDRWSLRDAKSRITISSLPENENLFLVQQKLYFPYLLKFHSRPVYNFLIKKQIRDILGVINTPIDIVWSFDLGNLFPLRFFHDKFIKVFHPVDEPRDRHEILSGAGADILFSVTREIIGKFAFCGVPSHFINHGLPDEFLAEEPGRSNKNGPLQTGMSGNLVRPDLDRKTLLQIIHENPDIIFNFYGSYTAGHSNIGAAEDEETHAFIQTLLELKNVRLHGVLGTVDLARELNRMDVLLICYDIKLDQSKGTNYHKVMEYLSTGKVIVSNNITTYQEYPNMICMVASRSDNAGLPRLFKETINQIDQYNSDELMQERRAFAHNNTYRKQLDRISELMKQANNGISKNFAG